MTDAGAGPGFKILAREDFSDVTFSLVFHHPLMAKAAQAGAIRHRDVARVTASESR